MTTNLQALAATVAVLGSLERLRVADDDPRHGGHRLPDDPDRFADALLALLGDEFGTRHIAGDAGSFSLVGVTRGCGSSTDAGIDVRVPLSPETAAWWQRRAALDSPTGAGQTPGPGLFGRGALACRWPDDPARVGAGRDAGGDAGGDVEGTGGIDGLDDGDDMDEWGDGLDDDRG